MAREFGKRSYNPENIIFIMNGMIGKDGEPWNHISRSLCKNILLAAYRTPATAEELAIEVGVALPYMEEELSCLVEATLMKKNGDKYETNFFIVSAEAQEKIYAHLRGITPELTQAVIASMDYELQWKNQNCPEWHAGYQSFDDMKWALLMVETDHINHATLRQFEKEITSQNPRGSWGLTVRPNGGEWDLLGMEMHHADAPAFVGLCGCVSTPDEKDLPEIMFRQFKYNYCGISEKTPFSLSYYDGQALVAVVNGKSDEVDEAVLKRLESYGYIEKIKDGYAPTILVIRKEKSHSLPEEEQERHEVLRKKAQEIATKHYLFCRELILKEIPDFLKDDEYQIEHACANIFGMRGAILEQAIKQGYLSFDKDNEKQMLGAFLVI